MRQMGIKNRGQQSNRGKRIKKENYKFSSLQRTAGQLIQATQTRESRGKWCLFSKKIQASKCAAGVGSADKESEHVRSEMQWAVWRAPGGVEGGSGRC